MASSSSFPSSSSSCSKRKRKRERKYWTDDESRILREYIEKQGRRETWEQVAINTGLREAGKSGDSCRRRWLNQLRPGIDKGPFTAEEDAKIIHLYNYYGGKNKWSKIAAHLHGRTDNQVKNRWNTKLSKDVEVGKQLIHEYTTAPEFNQDVDVGEQLLFEYTNAPDFNQDVEVGDQQLLFENTNAPDDFNEFSLSDQIYNYDFSEFVDLEMNSL